MVRRFGGVMPGGSGSRARKWRGVALMGASILALAGSVLLVLMVVYDPSGGRVGALFMAAAFAVLAFYLFSDGRNDFRVGGHKPPVWLRSRRGDDWSRGLLRNRPNRGALLQISVVLLTGVFALYYVGRSLWITAIVVAAAVTLLRPVRQTLRWIRSGMAVVHVGRLPACPGETLEGRIETSLAHEPPDGFEVKLSCLHCYYDDEGTVESALWKDHLIANRASLLASSSGVAVPFRFEIPPSAMPTNRDSSSEWVEWRLEATAELPGFDFHVAFDVPVVKATTRL